MVCDSRPTRARHLTIRTSTYNTAREAQARDEASVIRGTTRLIAHFGDPITPIQSPQIYNPYFERSAIDVVVVPMGVSRDDYPGTLRAVSRLTNTLGAIVTMPHKWSSVALLDASSPRVRA